jgi:hypothetical protein
MINKEVPPTKKANPVTPVSPATIDGNTAINPKNNDDNINNNNNYPEIPMIYGRDLEIFQILKFCGLYSFFRNYFLFGLGFICLFFDFILCSRNQGFVL